MHFYLGRHHWQHPDVAASPTHYLSSTGHGDNGGLCCLLTTHLREVPKWRLRDYNVMKISRNGNITSLHMIDYKKLSKTIGEVFLH